MGTKSANKLTQDNLSSLKRDGKSLDYVEGIVGEITTTKSIQTRIETNRSTALR